MPEILQWNTSGNAGEDVNVSIQSQNANEIFYKYMCIVACFFQSILVAITLAKTEGFASDMAWTDMNVTAPEQASMEKIALYVRILSFISFRLHVCTVVFDCMMSKYVRQNTELQHIIMFCPNLKIQANISGRTKASEKFAEIFKQNKKNVLEADASLETVQHLCQPIPGKGKKAQDQFSLSHKSPRHCQAAPQSLFFSVSFFQFLFPVSVNLLAQMNWRNKRFCRKFQ